ncbi:Stk1 family PASTA domain-containing Ser/Thr kinase [Anaerocolumna xylanovorans]|uniref:non-specific serine/threonine protein kinase n=1 Tax=Anaerocolumna xylanovorans DSM 12503 TaxID=1121345 RepID=A0A1M7YBM2_9FIRM|nr:Stk1 family PASTA domain-containing Ser/Thr kinase [Anaerocolumna xylanovorans]SHO49976.1 serine/threonine protein kinase [Anaerocolumna xylanovorans DSM 12503]
MLKPGMYISDRYEIIDKVGSGGMADVYKAKCHRLNRYVAIKVLKPEFSDDTNFVKKFRGEAQSAAGLSHPNIVSVYDVGDDNGLYYIVMELVEGITLKHFIERKGKLEVKEAVGIAIQIAMGMEAAHNNHIIHRDIKPQNIIISKEGKVKVTDFGIAKATNSNTITSNAMGSVHYLSPEQARGGYSDEKSDIYSLGITMYEMLSGQVPFAGDNTVSVALLHIQGEAIPLREIDPSIPLSVEKIVQKCMQKKPERRYLSASELIADLKRSISNPNGDFVVIPAAAATDSPTITISEEEVSHIKNASFHSGRNTGSFDTVKGNTNPDLRHTNTNLNKKVKDDEEEIDQVDPRIEKIILIGSIIVGIILVALIIFFTVNIFHLFPNNKGENNNPVETTATPTATPTEEEVQTVIMPSVVGYSLTDAEKMLAEKSEDLQIIKTEKASDTDAKGIVMEQYPAKGAEIDSDGEVRLVVSLGPDSFELPDVYNHPQKEAETTLTDKGLKVKFNSEYNDTVAEGSVISTEPIRGSLVKEGDTITVLLSKGPEDTTVLVPDVRNLSKADAVAKLKEKGLAAGNITKDYSDTYAKGKVMNQGPTGGSEVTKGSAVDLVLSLGPQGNDTPKSYTGSVTIDENPFDYPGDSGIILIQMVQDGKTTTLQKENKDYDSFPISISISSRSGSDATVIMFIGREASEGDPGAVSENGKWVVYEEYGNSWNVTFTPEN